MGHHAAKSGIAPKVLNLGCGFKQWIGATNVDAFDICKPDIVWNINDTPWPWAHEGEYDAIMAHHVFEHLDDWWAVFKECARVLKPGGTLEIKVPDESSGTALSYRDHHHVFTVYSFHGVVDGGGLVAARHGTNAWAAGEVGSVPLKAVSFAQVPHQSYWWMAKCFPWLMAFCARHMRNFIWEQIFTFEKLPIGEAKNE